MHWKAYILKEVGLYALFMQEYSFFLLFLAKNLGRELKISPNYDEISP